MLVGLCCAGPIFAYSATIRALGFAMIFRLVVMPMFLFSGAFFPISNLPAPLEVLARITPFFHGVELTRMLPSAGGPARLGPTPTSRCSAVGGGGGPPAHPRLEA